MRIFLLPLLALLLALPSLSCSNDDASILGIIDNITIGTTSAPRNGTIDLPAGVYDITVTLGGGASATRFLWDSTSGTFSSTTTGNTTWTSPTTPGHQRLTLRIDGDVDGKVGEDIYVFNAEIL
ncbi:MAG: hypothetical protein ABI743_00620 [bacterium]